MHNHHKFTNRLHHESTSLGFVIQSAMTAMLIIVLVQLLAVYLWPMCTPGVPCKDKRSQLEVCARGGVTEPQPTTTIEGGAARPTPPYLTLHHAIPPRPAPPHPSCEEQ